MTFEDFYKNLLGESYFLEDCFSTTEYIFDGEDENVYPCVEWGKIEDAIKKAYETGYCAGLNESKASCEPWGY